MPELTKVVHLPVGGSRQLDLFGSESSAALEGYVIRCDASDLSDAFGRAKGGQTFPGFDLIYVDPPFNNDQNFRMEVALTDDGPDAVSVPAFSDRWADGISGYLDMLREKLLTCHEALSERGWLAVHVDWKTDYRVRALLDDIFGGSDHWRNTVYWRRDPGGKGNKARTQQFPRNCDSIILFNKATEGWYFNLPRVPLTDEQKATYRNIDDNGRRFKAVDARNYSEDAIERMTSAGDIYVSSTGKSYKKYYLDEAEGVVDMLWTDIPGFGVRTGAKELTGYPTQKPIALIRRVIEALCPPGGWVADAFCGSGTTAVAALASGRNFVVSDVSSLACAVTLDRLVRSDASTRCTVRVVDGDKSMDASDNRLSVSLLPLPVRVTGSVECTTESVQIRNLELEAVGDDEMRCFIESAGEFLIGDDVMKSANRSISWWIHAAYLVSLTAGETRILARLDSGGERFIQVEIEPGEVDLAVLVIDCFGRSSMCGIDE